MAEHIGDEVGHVLGQRVSAAAQERHCARAFDEMDGGTRARAEGDVARKVLEAVARGIAGGRHQLDRVMHKPGVHIALAAFGLQRQELLGRGSGADLRRRPGHALHDGEFFLLARVPHQHFHHEAVDLGLGQRIGALGLDRVLRRHDEERFRNAVRLAGDGDLPFLHHLQKRALHLRRRAVDLVGEQQVGEDGPERSAEFARLLVVDARAD